LRDLIRLVRTAPDTPALSFLEGTPQVVIRAVRRGEIDIGFVHGAPDWARLEHEELWREPVMVLLPDHHPLANESDVRPAALRPERFLVAGGPAEQALHMPLVERVLGGAPKAVLAVPVERATLTDLVGLGFGVALTTGSALGAFHPGVAYRPIAAPVAAVAFHAVWRPSNHGSALAYFLEAARALGADRLA
jgi:DNA-binding transcriptional LysR family regulator